MTQRDSSQNPTGSGAPTLLHAALPRALTRRRPLLTSNKTQAFRAFSGQADGIDGVFIDIYGEGAVLIVYEGRPPRTFDPAAESAAALDILRPLGVRAIYHKPFAKDRSKLGGVLPATVTQATPIAGDTLPESILIRELDWQLEIRLYDGLSTGLFLDQRENRAFVSDWVAHRVARRQNPLPERGGRGGILPLPPTGSDSNNRADGHTASPGISDSRPTVLNTFAYTCAFSVAAAKGGAITTSVDVSARYLDWGKRNFAHNKLDPAAHRFAKMDTFDFLGYAKRKNLKYDLIILDPPSFATANKKKGIPAWSSIADYARLIQQSAAILNPKGLIFASTNTQELCRPGRLDREITKGLGHSPRWITLPAPPIDFANERDRFAARAFTV